MGHSDLWWIPDPDIGLPEGTFWAWGLGQQALFVIPEWDSVIVIQSDTTEFLKQFLPMISNQDYEAEDALKKLILSCRDVEERKSTYCMEHRFTSRREFEKLITLIQKARF